MRQTRIIRISFLLCAVFTVIAFWSGFYFGGKSSAPEQILTTSGETSRNMDTASEKPISASDISNSETDVTDKASDMDKTVESMKKLDGSERYYIRDDGEYLSVYYCDTDGIFLRRI